MSNRKISWKNRLLKIAEVFLVVVMVATIGNPKPLVAEDDVTELKYFVVKKEWKSDLESQRPASVSIHIRSTDGSYNNDINLSAESWEKTIILPHKDDNGNEIIYEVYENESESLAKYNLSNPSTNKIIISEENENCIIIDNNQSRSVLNPPYNLIEDTDKFLDAPFGNIKIDTRLLLEEATREYVDGEGNRIVIKKDETTEGSPFSYSTTTPKYTNPWDGSDVGSVVPRILYTGNLVGGTDNQVEGSIVLTWQDKATDILTGQKYPVQITVDNISIHSEVDANNKTISVMSNVNNLLEMESFVTTFGSLYENVVGVAADIQIKLVGVPSHSYTQIYITDLDVGDYVAGYHYGNTHPGTNPENYVSHNITDGYAEGVELKNGVASGVYLIDSNQTRLITNDNKTRFVDGTGSVDVNSIKNSLKFLAEVGDTDNCYKYRWTGSKCETAIITLSTIPGDYTNIISNTSSLYRVQYFFQLDNGDYPIKPDVPKSEEEIPATLVMVKPGTEVSVNTNAEKDPTKVDNTKKNYVLDSETTDVTGTKTTNSTEVTVLNVYFKKDCVVIYHDNYNDKLWKPEEQTYNHLDLNDPTPVYQKGETTKIPVNPGYAFKGWSEIDYEKWKEDGTDTGPKFEPYGEVRPTNVSKPETHYLAHWEALPNKYVVHYFYEVNGSYPSKPDYVSDIRTDKLTDQLASITELDKVPNSEKPNYYLNSGMNAEWEKPVAGDGSTILRVYFKRRSEEIKIPVTGIE